MKRLRIGLITGILLVGLLLAYWQIIEFRDVIFMGVLVVYEMTVLLRFNYMQIMDRIRVRNVLKHHGKEFTADICGLAISGKIAIESAESGTNFAYLCFDEEIRGADFSGDYATLSDKLGFNNAWFVGFLDEESLHMAGVMNLTIKKIKK